MNTEKLEEYFDKPLMSSAIALDHASKLLQACGYTLDEYGSDATGVKYRLSRADGTVVELSAVDTGKC